MNVQMNRNEAYDEINKMAPPKNDEMEACPAYGLVLQVANQIAETATKFCL